MPVKTPSFWYKPTGALSLLLTPVSWLYQIGHNINQALVTNTYQSSIPVICIGNAIAGGGGKTPTTIALVKLLKENGIARHPVILTRGYGANVTKATIVKITKHTANDVGDEALLLARSATTIVSPNRADGAKLAEQENADLIVMDDGLFHKKLEKTLTFLVIDRQIDFGNGKTIPAGPLREPLSKVLPKTNAVICIGRPLQSDKQVFEAALETTKAIDKSKNYVAFTGIAYPEKFKNTLNENNVNIVGWHEFPDHHGFNMQEIDKLKQEAKEKNAILITTEKDYVRLSSEMAKGVIPIPVEISIKDPENLVSYIKDNLK